MWKKGTDNSLKENNLSRFELLAGIGAENSGLSSLNLNHFNGVDIDIQNFKTTSL